MGSAFARVLDEVTWGLTPPAAPGEDQPAAPEGAAVSTDLPTVQDDDDLDRVLRDYLGVVLPNTRCCTGHRTPWEAVHDAFFARSAVSIWKASRGLGGKSFTLSALSMAEALFLRADVNILGGSGVQSKRVLEAIQMMWEHPGAPRQCLVGQPGSQVQKFVWRNRIQALMASTKSVRGPHPQRLRLDEVDEMKMTILDPAMGQPMTKGWIMSQIVLASTHQYPNGTMTAMLKRAADKGWPVFEWCYLENLEPRGWLSLAEVERKRAILTAQMWEVEIELQEPSAEGRAMDTPLVEQAFRPDVVLEDPVEGATYGTGADWAKKKNWTFIVTIRTDVRPLRVVAVTRAQKLPWPVIVQMFDAQCRRYPGVQMHDNTGLGQVVHDLLTVGAEPFDMVGRQRQELLSEYLKAIENKDLVWPRHQGEKTEQDKALAQAYGEHKYATVEDIYKGGKDGSTKHHLPDSISAAAFAWRCGASPPAAGATSDPDPATRHLDQDSDPHRMSGYIMGRRRPGNG